jgi:glycosyltransferase involved in cell wall biosynthesis
MRIVYVLTTLAMGGAERQVLSIAGRMAARGHAVALLVVKSHEPEDCGTDLNVVHLNIGKNATSVIAGLRRGTAFLRQFRPDVIHSHNFHGNMLARMMRLSCRDARLIATIHNVYEGGRMRMLAYRVSDWLVERTTAVSGAVAERFIKRKAVHKSKCVVVTNWIETADFAPNAERRLAMREQMGVSDEFVWLSVGRITAAKDIPNLLRAFGVAWREVPQMELWIAGNAPTPGKKINVAISMPHGAMDRVRWLGLRRDVAALLDAADGFVLSSAWEGMPLALGEAMAMEKPALATDVGGVPELVGECGVIVPPRNAAALPEAMLALMRRTQHDRDAMGRLARERIVKHFSMDRKADEWEALYHSVLS